MCDGRHGLENENNVIYDGPSRSEELNLGMIEDEGDVRV